MQLKQFYMPQADEVDSDSEQLRNADAVTVALTDRQKRKLIYSGKYICAMSYELYDLYFRLYPGV